MKKAFYINSISTKKEDGYYYYAPISQNVEWIFGKLKACNLKCIEIKQYYDDYWYMVIKGRRKNVEDFMTELIVKASSIYSIRETIV